MNAELQNLGRRLVGRWTTEATHPGLPGTIIRGSSAIEWLEGERFLIYRSSYDHPDIPDSISIIGDTEGLRMHYFDTRGVHRILKVTVTREGWEMAMDRHSSAGSFASPDAPFSQRMTYTFEDEDRTMSGKAMLSYDNVNWDDDLEITYRRLL
ncbi:MAG: hypothetical protein DMF54_07185 [Acidobacteria bacterium]|nr:MAG: hypothetical protein DMF54_07185 [Acidobacteriota bacterium]